MKISALSSAGEVTPEIADAISRLLPQLSKNASPLSQSELGDILDSGNCILFLAKSDDCIVGSLTLISYTTPTEKRARIEDVVVDENHRGQGIAMALNTAALEAAKKLGVKTVDLTSNPERKAANALYKKLGFELRNTNTYRKVI